MHFQFSALPHDHFPLFYISAPKDLCRLSLHDYVMLSLKNMRLTLKMLLVMLLLVVAENFSITPPYLSDFQVFEALLE